MPSAVSCTEYTSQEDQDEGTNVGSANNRYYIGTTYNYGTEKTLCRADVMMKKAAGSITGKTFTVEVYTLSGNDLNALQGTSDGVTGSDAWNLTWVEFTFSSPFVLSASTDYGIVVTMNEADGSNYADTRDDATGAWASGNIRAWDNTKTAAADWASADWTFKLYSQ